MLSVSCDRLLPSDELSPALPQWAALSDVCAGALSPSKFPVMVDGFCRLAFTDRRPHLQCQKATTVDALAHALAELSKVSNGSVSTVTFEGGYDCGWIAAVAEWLLCLKVKVLTEEGSCLYWQDSSHTNDSAQVIVIFDTHSPAHDLAKTKELRVVNRSFRLPCDGEVKVIHRVGADSGEIFGMGRSSWSTILEDTFGSAFNMLFSPNILEAFTTMLLSVIRAYKPDSPMVFSHNRREAIHPWTGPRSCPGASRERAFFLAIAKKLPELSPLLKALEKVQNSAGATAGPRESQLLEFCDCEVCGQRSRKEPSLKGHSLGNNHVCLHHLGMTLITLICLLSGINVDETIKPASMGLLMLHNSIPSDISNPVEGCVLSQRLLWDHQLVNIYDKTLELFTGLPSHFGRDELRAASAICHGGICIWLPALENPLYDPFQQMGVRVLPGKVSFRDRLYKGIVDMAWSEVAAASIMPDIAAYGISRVGTFNVRETLNASKLEACIELRSGKTSSAFNAYLDHLKVERPERLTSEVRLHITSLYGNMYRSIDHETCKMSLGNVRSHDLPKPDITTWGHPCPSLALNLESQAPPKMSYNYPEVGEWVVVRRESDNGAVRVKIFRGDFSLLYYLMRPQTWTTITLLSCFDGCIRCLARRVGFGDDIEAKALLIEVHTITEKECTLWSAKMTGRLPKH